MNILMDDILDGKINISKIKKLTKEDKRIILSTLVSKINKAKNKSDKLKYYLIVDHIKNS